MKLALPILLVLLAAAAPAAEEFSAVQSAARRDLDAALQELAEARARVEAEKLPLAQQIGELEDRLLKRRAEGQAAERA
ncbi:MAG TPA: hypothetical protein PKE47_02010, partial [Verrucomicrobiota bacterium]|nr:hypothetical protein [Verrucomicrobiota bacterium]